MKLLPGTRQLSTTEWRVVAVVFLAQVALGARVRVGSVVSLAHATPRFRAVARRLVAASDERVTWAIEAVGRRMPGVSTCLVRALAADLFLSRPDRRGYVRIGVRRANEGRLESHAWFEHEGRIVVGGAGASDYVHFVTLDTTPPECA